MSTKIPRTFIAAGVFAGLLILQTACNQPAAFPAGETTLTEQAPVLQPKDAPQSTSAPQPTDTPQSTSAPQPTDTPLPTAAPQPTDTPLPTATPQPTDTPLPTAAPLPTIVRPNLVPLFPAPTPAIVEPKSDEEDAMFEFLTGAYWQSWRCDVPGAGCTMLEFRKDGRYEWVVTSDAVERNRTGQWNFRLRDAGSGVISMDNGSLFAFARKDDNLAFINGGDTLFSPSVEPAIDVYKAARPECCHSLAERYEFSEQIIEGFWSKSNEFDLATRPETIEFYGDGGLDYTYRDGACAHGGMWSVEFTNIRTQLFQQTITVWSEENDCDVLRSPSNYGPRVRHVGIESGSMFIYFDSYRDSDERPESKTFRLGVFSHLGLQIDGEYKGSFTPGVPISLDLTFKIAESARTTYELGNFEISMHILDEALERLGEPTVLLTKDYSGIRPGRDGPFEDSVSIVPVSGGVHQYLIFELDMLVDPDSPDAYTNKDWQYLLLSMKEPAAN